MLSYLISNLIILVFNYKTVNYFIVIMCLFKVERGQKSLIRGYPPAWPFAGLSRTRISPASWFSYCSSFSVMAFKFLNSYLFLVSSYTSRTNIQSHLLPLHWFLQAGLSEPCCWTRSLETALLPHLRARSLCGALKSGVVSLGIVSVTVS